MLALNQLIFNIEVGKQRYWRAKESSYTVLPQA